MNLLDFMTYFLFIFFRCFFNFIQLNIYWRLNGVLKRLENVKLDANGNGQKLCQILKIVYRKKLILPDLAHANNFLCIHENFISMDSLLENPNWTIYSVDEKFVNFVLLPKPLHFYNARESPFFYITQFFEAQKFAKIPLQIFCEHCNEKMESPRGNVLFISSVGRSGSTLVTRMLQVRLCCNDSQLLNTYCRIVRCIALHFHIALSHCNMHCNEVAFRFARILQNAIDMNCKIAILQP
jgi:hypothetical protein